LNGAQSKLNRCAIAAQPLYKHAHVAMLCNAAWSFMGLDLAGLTSVNEFESVIQKCLATDLKSAVPIPVDPLQTEKMPSIKPSVLCESMLA
jgi:hypothetical protein